MFHNNYFAEQPPTGVSYERLVFLMLTFSVPIPDKEKKLTQIFIFIVLCDASKAFIKAFNAFINRFESPQKKIKICVDFHFNTTFWNARGEKGWKKG